MVRTLLDRVKMRKRASLIASRTKRRNGKRRIEIDGKHTLPATTEQKKEIARWLAAFAKSQSDPKFFEILDVAVRVAGVGSLGLDRYVILVRGDGGSDGNALLDAKQARPSSLAKFDKERQPVWKSEADRIVSIQHRMQAMAPALLDAVRMEHGGYVLRELQPSKDRLTLKDAKGHPRRVRPAIETMGRLTAWAQLRSSGREGSAIIDDLIAFARTDSWQRGLIAYARSYAARVDRDHKELVAAQKEGR
jgi:uncharacterized protein (DUF2252 family)